VDTLATTKGEKGPSKQGRRSILIYKSYMYKEASLDPERCNFKVDQKVRNQWVANHARQIGQFEDVNSPIIITRDEAMKEDPFTEAACNANRLNRRTDIPPGGCGGRAPAEGTAAGTTTASTIRAGVVPPTVVTHLRFGTPEPLTIPLRARGGTTTNNNNTSKQHNMFAPLRQQGSESGYRGSEALRSGISEGGTHQLHQAREGAGE